MEIREHFSTTGNEAFDVHTQQYTIEDRKQYRVSIQSHPSRSDNHGVPANVIELFVSGEQLAKLHEATEPWTEKKG